MLNQEPIYLSIYNSEGSCQTRTPSIHLFIFQEVRVKPGTYLTIYNSGGSCEARNLFIYLSIYNSGGSCEARNLFIYRENNSSLPTGWEADCSQVQVRSGENLAIWSGSISELWYTSYASRLRALFYFILF